MNKKLIQVTAPLEPTAEGKQMTVQIIGDCVVLNLYKDKELYCRYAMNQEGTQYATYMNGKWGRRRLECVAARYSWYSGISDIEDYEIRSRKQRKELLTFMNKKGIREVFSSISHNEWCINRDKSERAYERKVDRIDKTVNELPLVPDSIEDWVKDKVFSENYMFYSKEKDIYYCTACGKTHHFVRKILHNDKVICKRKMVSVEVKKRNIISRERTDNITVIQKVPDSDALVIKIMKARCVWNRCNKNVDLYSEILLIKEAEKAKTQILYGQYSERDEVMQVYWTSNPYSKRFIYKNLYIGSLKSEIAGTCFEDLGYVLETIQKYRWDINYSTLVDQYHWIGKLEYLIKANLYYIVKDILYIYEYWNWVSGKCSYNLKADSVDEFLKINMQRVHRLKQYGGGVRFLQWLQWEEETGKHIKDTAIDYMDNFDIGPKAYEFIQDRMTVVQFVNYIQKQMENPFYREEDAEPTRIIEDWKDYLNMSEQLGYPVMDEIVYKPKDLALRHAQRVEQTLQKNYEKQCADLREKYSDIEAFLKECKPKYEYEDENYRVIIPDSIMDIVLDGAVLKHCVASSEIYFDRMNRKESFIGFVRRKEQVDIPYYTLEIQPGGNIRQQRTSFNRQTGLDEIKDFLKTYQREVRKNLNDKDMNLAKESTRLHLANLKMLKASEKVRDNELADILETDYMEAV